MGLLLLCGLVVFHTLEGSELVLTECVVRTSSLWLVCGNKETIQHAALSRLSKWTWDFDQSWQPSSDDWDKLSPLRQSPKVICFYNDFIPLPPLDLIHLTVQSPSITIQFQLIPPHLSVNLSPAVWIPAVCSWGR